MRYLFEDCVLDVDKRELRRGADVVSVTPQVFDLLNYLIRNREHVVTKADLISAVSQGRIVSDAALTTRMNAARRAIGDSGEEQRLVKTLPRRGFRFVCSIKEVSVSAHAGPVDIVKATSRPTLTLPDKPSIAVLPFANLSGDPQQEYFADGITDDITTELSRFAELFVIARNSSFHYKRLRPEVGQIGRELGVRYILQGGIRRSGPQIRISAQLIDAATGAHRWAERYDRHLEDVFAVQDEVARGIVTTLVAHVNRAETERTRLKPPETWQAHDYCLRAIDVWVSFWSSLKRDELYQMRSLLEHALTIDPNYARIYSLLALAHFLAWNHPLDSSYLNPMVLDRAHQLALQAVRLDGNSSEAHGMLGLMLVWKRQHDAAIAEFERAARLNPNFAQWNFAWVLIFAGEAARAIDVCHTCMRHDPFYLPFTPACLALAHFTLGRYAEALPLVRESISRSPNYRGAHLIAAATYAHLGQMEEARHEAKEVLRLEPLHTIEGTAKRIMVFKHRHDAERFFYALRKAGLPERQQGREK